MKKKYDTNVWIKVILEDDTEYLASSPDEIVKAMKMNSWSRPESVKQYKEIVQKYTYAAKGKTFVFWDATSFLFGLQKCGVVKSINMEVFINERME